MIACGFGAIVLFYTILSAQAGVQREERNDDLQAEVDRLEEEVLEGYKNLVVLRNSLESTDEAVPAEGLAARIVEETERLQAAARRGREGHAVEARDHRAPEAGPQVARGRHAAPQRGHADPGKPGTRIKGFVGSGDRQYLTGLKVGGQRILILVDVSASMMDESVVNVIRLRNMPEVRRMAAAKWRRTVGTVDWLTSQLPAKREVPGLRVQHDARGRWCRAARAAGSRPTMPTRSAARCASCAAPCRRTAPASRTRSPRSRRSSPRPDNVILVTDGLPTQGASPPGGEAHHRRRGAAAGSSSARSRGCRPACRST